MVMIRVATLTLLFGLMFTGTTLARQYTKSFDGQLSQHGIDTAGVEKVVCEGARAQAQELYKGGCSPDQLVAGQFGRCVCAASSDDVIRCNIPYVLTCDDGR